MFQFIFDFKFSHKNLFINIIWKIKNFIEKHDPKHGITLFSHEQLIKVLQANTKDCPVEFYAKWRIIIEEDII